MRRTKPDWLWPHLAVAGWAKANSCGRGRSNFGPLRNDSRSDSPRWTLLLTDYFNGDGSWASTPADRQRIIASQLPPNRHEWDAGSESTTAQVFDGVAARTLILRGSLTRLVTKETADALCQAFPHWQFHEIEGAGHMGPLTHGAIVNAKLQSFLSVTP